MTNMFDFFLVGIWLLSFVYGWFQGLARAMTSGLPGLISSVYIAFLCLGPFKEFLTTFNAHGWVIQFALPILTFIVLLLLKAIGGIIGQIAERTHTKFIDDILGSIWGVVRGAAIIKLIFWIITYVGMDKLKDTSLVYPWFASIIQVF
jgi:uncharacterized membrane protein required for colicin V production